MITAAPVDAGLFDEVNGFARHTAWLHGPLLAYASYGVAVFAALLVAGFLLARRRDVRTVAASLWAGAATLLAVALNQPLVNGFHEPRPYTVQRGILVLVQRSADFSFPSDHAVMAGAAAAGLWLVSRRLGLLATVAALLMAFARVYIGAHYPHDVAVGLLTGAAVALLGWLVVAAPLTWLVRRLATGPVRPLLRSGPGAAM